MRTLAATLATLSALSLVTGCTRATIVESQGPRVTYAWNSEQTNLQAVFRLAMNYCQPWNAPAALVSDTPNGTEHRSVFVCRPPPQLPIRKLF